MCGYLSKEHGVPPEDGLMVSWVVRRICLLFGARVPSIETLDDGGSDVRVCVEGSQFES